MVLLEKRETRPISLSVRGLKARGPAESSNLINERVNYAHIADVDLGAYRKDLKLQLRPPASGEILRGGGMEGSKRCGFSAGWIDLFYRYGARGGCLDRIQGSKSKRLNDARHEVL